MIRKEKHSTSGRSKAEKKRSGHAGGDSAPVSGAPSPYASHAALDDLHDEHDPQDENSTPFVNFNGETVSSFGEFAAALGDKHEQLAAIKALMKARLKTYAVHHPATITTGMAAQTLALLQPALHGATSAKRAKKSSGSSASSGIDLKQLSVEVEASRTLVANTGAALAIAVGDDDPQLYDTWATSLMAFVGAIVRGTVGSIESQIQEIQSAGASLASSPTGVVAAGLSSQQRKALAETAGCAAGLVNACLEDLAFLAACDPDVVVDADNTSLPAALLELANFVLPANAAVPQAAGDFPVPNRISVPVAATGGLLRALAAVCEPAQGPKVRALVLRCVAMLCGCTTPSSGATANEDDEDIDSLAETDTSANPLMGGEQEVVHTHTRHITSYTTLIAEIMTSCVETMGILATRFPSMVAPAVDPASTGSDPPAALSTPLMSVQLHLVPIGDFMRRKVLGKGRPKRQFNALLRQVALKFADVSGLSSDALEVLEAAEASTPNRSPSKAATPVIAMPPTLPEGDLPMSNPNRGGLSPAPETDATPGQCPANAADPSEVIQFRDTIAVCVSGFDQCYLLSCLRNMVRDGLKNQLGHNPAVRRVFKISTDVTRAVSRDERKVTLHEAHERKEMADRDRKKDRERKTHMQMGDYE